MEQWNLGLLALEVPVERHQSLVFELFNCLIIHLTFLLLESVQVLPLTRQNVLNFPQITQNSLDYELMYFFYFSSD